MDTLVYKNKFGQLFESHFSILQSGFMQDYTYVSLRKIQLLKTRNYQYNKILFLLSIATALVGFLLRSISPLLFVLGCIMSVVLLYFCFLIKKYRYQLQIRTMNSELIRVEVAKVLVKDAKTLVRKLNRKRKEGSNYLQAG